MFFKLLLTYVRSALMTWVIFSFVSLISIFLITTVPGAILGSALTNLFFWITPDASGSLNINLNDILTAFGWSSLIVFVLQLILTTSNQKRGAPAEVNLRRRLTRGLTILFLMFLATAGVVPFMPLSAGTSIYGMLLTIAGFALSGLIAYSLIIFIGWLEIKIWTPEQKQLAQ